MMQLDIRWRRATLIASLTLLCVACANTPDKPTVEGVDALSEADRQTFEQALQKMEQGAAVQAEPELARLAKSGPQVREIWLNLALAQYQQKDLEKAAGTVATILQRWENTAPAHNLAGLIAVQEGQFDLAKQHYMQALRINPNYANALYNMALLLDVYLQDIANAVQYYELYLELADSDEDTRIWMEELKLTLHRGDQF